MHLDHDTTAALEEAVALINSDDPRTGVDSLDSPAALSELVTALGITGTREGTDTELRAVHRMRRRLSELFELAQTGAVDAAVTAINALIADTRALPQLVDHDGLPLHLHFTPSDAPLDRRLGAQFAIALAVVVRDGGVDRLRRCASPDCGRALVDLTRNRSRRYCDTQCGNRQHVAAYRSRRSPGPPAST